MERKERLERITWKEKIWGDQSLGYLEEAGAGAGTNRDSGLFRGSRSFYNKFIKTAPRSREPGVRPFFRGICWNTRQMKRETHKLYEIFNVGYNGVKIKSHSNPLSNQIMIIQILKLSIKIGQLFFKLEFLYRVSSIFNIQIRSHRIKRKKTRTKCQSNLI